MQTVTRPRIPLHGDRHRHGNFLWRLLHGDRHSHRDFLIRSLPSIHRFVGALAENVVLDQPGTLLACDSNIALHHHFRDNHGSIATQLVVSRLGKNLECGFFERKHLGCRNWREQKAQQCQRDGFATLAKC